MVAVTAASVEKLTAVTRQYRWRCGVGHRDGLWGGPGEPAVWLLRLQRDVVRGRRPVLGVRS